MADTDNYALTPEQLAQYVAAAPQQARKKQERRFVVLPYNERVLKAMARRDASGAVLMELAWQEFKTHKAAVLLSNAALQAAGVSRFAKLRALRNLEADGLISVKPQGKGRSPLVTIWWETPGRRRTG